jgi:hypothetical protein
MPYELHLHEMPDQHPIEHDHRHPVNAPGNPAPR